jgi:hypothetical protein
MRRTPRSLLFAPLALAFALPVSARDYAEQADRAVAEEQAAVTVFVDVDWGGREDGAAKELTRAHTAFAARGYQVVDVEGYIENGDLQGFFATYRLEREARR